VPVAVHRFEHFLTPPGDPPGPPTAVTSITRDAGATVSFRAPSSSGSGSITHYVVTPYIGGSAQSATTVAVASLAQLTGSDGNTYQQASVTGLTNSTAYTFTVKARNSYGDSTESAASAANTPLAGLVFGDDFNGPADGPIDPEWWVYTRCGFLNQSEVQYYLPSQVRLDGAGSLQLIADHTSYTGPKYPSAGGGSITQPWRSGAVQSNTKTWAPASGNTMTYEARFQVCPDAGGAMWPGLLWLEGQDYLDAWKTDPAQTWNSTGKAEIDVAEFFTVSAGNFINGVNSGSWTQQYYDSGLDLTAGMHAYSAQWKPGVRVRFLFDGAQTWLTTSNVPASGCQFFLLLYLQIVAGSAASPQHCSVDYVRVYDQNLG
jgi:Fibronectin type III domain